MEFVEIDDDSASARCALVGGLNDESRMYRALVD